MKIPTFPGKYHQNGGFSMAMLVYRRVTTFKSWDDVSKWMLVLILLVANPGKTKQQNVKTTLNNYAFPISMIVQCSNPSPNISRKIRKQNQALISFLALKGHNDCNCSLQIVGFIFGKVPNLEFETSKSHSLIVARCFPHFCPPIFGRENSGQPFFGTLKKKARSPTGKYHVQKKSNGEVQPGRRVFQLDWRWSSGISQEKTGW